MKRYFYPFLFSILFILIRSDEPTIENGIYVLTDNNFDSFLEEHPTVLVEFYAPWCGHCKQLAPEYEKAAEELGDSVPLAKVDATVEKILAERFEINGYPTLKFWQKDHEPIDYDGDRDAQGIVKWLKEKTDPDYKPPPEEVIALTEQTFDDFLGSNALTLVEFYAPWCGHCKKLAPEYEKAAIRLKAHGIPLAKVDATIEKKLAELYDVKGFPTLKIFRNARRFDYDGPRDADGIVNYVIEQSKPAVKFLNHSSTDKFISNNDVTIVGFFDSESGPLYDAFVDAAERTRADFSCYYVTDPSVIKEFKVKPGTITIFYPKLFVSKYEKGTKDFPKPTTTTEELLTFYRENATPLVGHMTRVNSATRYSRRPLVAVYYNVDFSLAYRDGTQYWRNKVVDIAHKYKGKFYFAVADEEEFAKELEAVGLGTSGLEQNVIIFGIDGKKYPMDSDKYDEDLEENLVTFLKDFVKGKVQPHLKSQQIPKADKGPVFTLVGNNFEAIVNDESKDVLIEAYAPWCGHCKAFEQPYKQFATKLTKQEPNLIFTKIDATENDLPEKYKVEGFPTIFFAPAGKKDDPIKYTGNRDSNDLLKFLKDNAVRSFQSEREKEKDEL
uniref:Protein disulfide-isomerase n=1 Tax=Meloidogyne incognita TaxID=6306 RepID=A0A914LUP9_MELIC